MDLHRVLAVFVTFVAMLFLYSGVAKLISLRSFIQDLLRVPYLPHRLSRVVGVAVPLAEIMVACFLVLNFAWAKIFTIALLLAFSGVAWIATTRNQKVPCNCFGAEASEHLSMGTVVRNTILATLTAVSMIVPAQHSPPLTEIHALMSFLLFLAVNKAIQNYRDQTQSPHAILS